jgi:glycosyltransferase involved in cell wall biosynthesis
VRVLLLGAHSILEFDDVLMFHELGHEVASIGAYIDPSAPQDDKRPALPQVPMVQTVKDAVDALGQQGIKDTLAAAKANLPDAILDWAEVIIVSAFEREWLLPQYDRWKDAGKRVIWRTIGQSGDANEAAMRTLRARGLEIVRYSPREKHIPNYAGQDAVIRFYKDPDEWHGWTGEDAVVTNVTQAMFDRHPWCNPAFWAIATEGLAVRPMGPRSEVYGGIGEVGYETMKEGLRRARCYLYVGTQPASYTLGLIEAMMTGCPVVSIGASHMRILPYGPALFEGHEIAARAYDDPHIARAQLQVLLDNPDYATAMGLESRLIAIDLFGKDRIFDQWAAYIGAAVPQAVAA